MSLGRGHNSSTIVQTLGRATFNGRNVQKDNGFDIVTVLTTSNDYTLCLKKQNYINQVDSRQKYLMKMTSSLVQMTMAMAGVFNLIMWCQM